MFKVAAYVRGFIDQQHFVKTHEQAQILRSQLSYLMEYDDVRIEDVSSRFKYPDWKCSPQALYDIFVGAEELAKAYV